MQTTTITVEFTTPHNPGTEAHLQFIVEKYLKEKGVIIRDGKIVI
jgi:hypothetical protein